MITLQASTKMCQVIYPCRESDNLMTLSGLRSNALNVMSKRICLYIQKPLHNIHLIEENTMAKKKVFLIGIDGGATKTRGIITGEDGIELASSTGGSTNQYTNSMDVVKWNLQTILEHLLRNAGGKTEDVRGICLGLAGVDKPADAKHIRNMVATLLPQTDINVTNDSVIGLYGGCKKSYGIIIISGTGSIAYGRNQKGNEYRTGGWGHILGDEGSGYSIVLRALRAICRAADNRDDKTLLTDIILKGLNLGKPIELMDWVKDIQGDKAKISSLSPMVYEACAQKDNVALSIIDSEAYELVIAVKAVHRALFKSHNAPLEVVVGGSNLTKSQLYYQTFKQKTEEHLKGVQVILPRTNPVNGAILFLQIRYGLVVESG